MRVQSIINKDNLIGLSEEDRTKLVINTLLTEVQKTFPNATAEDGMLIHYRYLDNGDLHVRCTYYEYE